MSNLRSSRLVAAAAVILVLGAGYALAGLGHTLMLSSGSVQQAPHVLAVSNVTRVCPAPGASSTPGSGVVVLAAPAGTGSASSGPASSGPASPAPGSGAAVLTRLAGGGSVANGPSLVSITQPGVPKGTTVPTDHAPKAPPAPKVTIKPTTKPTVKGGKPTASQSPPPQQASSVPATATLGGVVVQATGAMSQGLDVEQTTGGVPDEACASPGTDFWFTGPGQRTTAHIALYLMNPSAQVADANVDIFTDAGPLQETTDTGITVPAHGMVVQSLSSVLRNSRAISLHVRTSVGQIVAAAQESTASGPGAWLPATSAPATQLIIPGLPNSVGTRDLYVSVPGLQDATVQLAAVSSRGTYEPTGATGIDIPGGSAVEIALPSMSGIPAALKLTSNTPITAAALIPAASGGSPGAFTTATPAITEQGVIADSPVGGGKLSQLVLSAPRAAAQVSVTEIASAGSATPKTQTVQIPAGHTVVEPLSALPGAPKGSVIGVVITPMAGSGPVYAGRVISTSGAGGRLAEILPVASALTSVPLPPVRNITVP